MGSEIWKAIEGYPNAQISSHGRVRVAKSLRIRKTWTIRYERIILTRNKIQKHWLIHRLVALHFLPNPEGKNQVNHIDGNRENNFIENLEWNTQSENMTHVFKSGLKNHRGLNNPNNKAKVNRAARLKT